MISINAWEEEFLDDVEYHSKGKFSIFTWGHGKFVKSYEHNPVCTVAEMPINKGGLCEFETFFAQNLDVFKEEKAFRNISTPVDNFILNNYPERDPAELTNPPVKATLKSIDHPFSRFLEDGTFPVDDICPPCEDNSPQCNPVDFCSSAENC